MLYDLYMTILHWFHLPTNGLTVCFFSQLINFIKLELDK